jgi:flagellar assembly factor FliW
VDDKIISFGEGVLGLPEWNEAVLLPVEGVPSLYWLQFLHDEEAAFLVLDVLTLFPKYDVALAKGQASLDGDDTVVLTTVSVPGGDFSKATTNLMGPVVLAGLKGRQVVLHDTEYPLRQPLFGGQ